ncbi:hypothetical protein N7516_001069 [Penicillium verrucosum]|uniref:uncharacterized protein n=1 Tax=Penicillium verrucosum TaxID=60171 RepID=UPI0025454380|nr:uncharacterized protein N7516_001069 [Penicillium verrucosum]KAJ5940901.1 hypothetical protein N7516_001069 [Penicillium verrucosum]
MHTAEQRYNCLSRELLQLTTGFFLPVTTLVSFSLLSLIFIHRYIKYRRLRQTNITPISQSKQEEDQDFCFQSTMEKGNIVSSASRPPSACDILQPLSHTSLLPSSGALAAQAREQQREISSTASSPPSPMASSFEVGEEVQKRNETIQQMCDEDDEGVRTWKRVVVEYR